MAKILVTSDIESVKSVAIDTSSYDLEDRLLVGRRGPEDLERDVMQAINEVWLTEKNARR